jgi:hypothetical protein
LSNPVSDFAAAAAHVIKLLFSHHRKQGRGEIQKNVKSSKKDHKKKLKVQKVFKRLPKSSS